MNKTSYNTTNMLPIALGCALGLSIPLRAGAQEGSPPPPPPTKCYMDGPRAVCAPAGTVVDEWEVTCTIQGPEGPGNSSGWAELITANKAYKTTVKPLAPPGGWGVVGILDVISWTDVSLTLEEPDPDDCSQTVTTEDYDSDTYECDGQTIDLMSKVCW